MVPIVLSLGTKEVSSPVVHRPSLTLLACLLLMLLLCLMSTIVQELEGEVSLLSEQLRAAEAKFRETEKALQR